MIRLSALLACCLGLSSTATANEAAEEFGSAFYTGLSISVVQVRVLNAAGKGYFGSGVVVAENEVITNCHVTRQAVRIEVAKGALVYPVFGQKADMSNDLCLLRTGPMPLRVAELRDAGSVKAGEKSFYYGYSGGIEAFFAPGRVATTHPHDGMAVIETSSGFALGGSGGGRVGNATYSQYLAYAVQKILREDSRTRNLVYRVQVELWLTAGGDITRVEMTQSSGDAQIDAALVAALREVGRLDERPPASVSMPIRARVTGRRPG